MANAVMPKIEECVEANQSFIVRGGAGSGKTHTLMETIKVINKINKNPKIACITYTKAAVAEIKRRDFSKNVEASTFHEFVWSLIKGYQRNIKKCLVKLILNNDIIFRDENKNVVPKEEFNVNYFDSFPNIEYRDYSKICEGIISHNDVIKLSRLMFDEYPLLCQIVRDKYKYILLDEYQDTLIDVVNILIVKLLTDERKIVIGMFGDRMQSIYIEKNDIDILIDEKIQAGLISNIKKEDNYRCSKNVIKLLNKVRDDGIVQEPSLLNENGKVINKEGRILFIYSNNPIDIEQLKKNPVFHDWNFSDAENTKELYLTHKLIANKLGYLDLLSQFKNNEDLIKDPIPLVNLLFKAAEIKHEYTHGKISKLLLLIDKKIKTHEDKAIIKKLIEQLISDLNGTIENAIQSIIKTKLITISDTVWKYLEPNGSDYNLLYESIKGLAFSKIESVYKYVKEMTPYSTQHNIKGTEYENVLVVLDNGKWNNYNFEKYLANDTSNIDILNRTKKIFYVCCSRAKNDLVVFMEKPSLKAITKAKEFFGETNVMQYT